MTRKPRRHEPVPKLNWPIVVAIIVATALAYLPAFAAPFVMDDIPAIDANAAIRQLVPAGAPAPGNPIAGRPVARASLAINYAINDLLGVDQRQDPNGPRKTVGYHLLNLLFHLCTGALLFGVIRRTMREPAIPADWRSLADPVAGVTCALWLLHPIQSEVLNYVVQRTEGLASLFYIATLYCSIRAWDTESATARARWYVAGVIACVLGLGSKEIAITIPLMVVLYDRAFRVPTWRAIVRPRSHRGWFYIALAVASIASFVGIASGARGATAGFATGIPWYSYFYSQCWAIAHYLYLVVVPGSFTVDYGNQAIHGARGIAGLILLSAFAIATLVAWTKVPRFGWFAFAGSWFFLLLAPSSSFVPIGTEIAAERRVYLALCAILLLGIIGAESVRRRYAARVTSRQLFIGFGAVATVLAAGTAARSYTYSDSERLWRNAAEHAPLNPRAFDNLGDALFRATPPKYAAAESADARAVALGPDLPIWMRQSRLSNDRAVAVRGSGAAARARGRRRSGQPDCRAPARARAHENSIVRSRDSASRASRQQVPVRRSPDRARRRICLRRPARCCGRDIRRCDAPLSPESSLRRLGVTLDAAALAIPRRFRISAAARDGAREQMVVTGKGFDAPRGHAYRDDDDAKS